ncbi:M23 family metallopeptidase [Aquimarina muelleri]|uniref:M23 family metallopeptidase n=1 Tax=Aquimarina muelleri TaxID=279356 RepID=UPI003F6833E7
MLKVAKTLQLKDFMEVNSAVILGSEPVFVEHMKLITEPIYPIDPWPVKEFYNGHKRRLGSGYGPRNVKNRPEASKFHRGLDINFGGGYDDYGAPVISTHDGIIVEAKDTTTGSGGRTITVQSKDGNFQTRYNHLSEISVELNQEVNKGQTLGKLGASAWGKEKGSDSHLHYAIKKKNAQGKMDWYNPTDGKENKEENMVDPQTWIQN